MPTNTAKSTIPSTSTREDAQAQQVAAGRRMSAQLISRTTVQQQEVDLKRANSTMEHGRELDSSRLKRLRQMEVVPRNAIENADAKATLQCSSSAPIRQLNPDEIASVLDAFRASLKQWDPDFVPQAAIDRMEIDEPVQQMPALTPEEKISQDRLQDTYDLIAGIE